MAYGERLLPLPRHAHGESFWQEVERLMNDAYKVLFMDSSMPLSVDSLLEEETSLFSYVIGLFG
jgi:hypothetical protein